MVKSLMKRSWFSSLMWFILATGTMVAVACGNQPSPPPPTATENVTSSQVPSPAVTTTLESETDTDTPAQEVPGGDRSLRVISSRSAAVPLGPNPARVSNLSQFPLSQGGPPIGGLTVSVNGSVTVEADEAYVVVFPPQVYGSSGPVPINSNDQKEVIAKLAEIGIEEQQIEFGSQQSYGPPNVSVEVDVGQLPGIGEAVLKAVEDVLSRSERHGVRFGLSTEKCDEALALARREAIPQAHRSAENLAAALGVNRGNVLGVLEFPAANIYGPQSVNICGGQFSDPLSVTPLDSEPEAEVSVGLQVTYSLE